MSNKWMLVFVPSPGMEHLNQAVELAKLLINHHDRLSIVLFVILPYADDHTLADVNSFTSSLTSIHALRFCVLPYQLTINSPSLHPSAVLDSLIQNQKPSVKNTVSNLISDPNSPPLAAFVVDFLCASMIDVAAHFNVPSFLFFPHSASFFFFQLHTFSLKLQGKVNTTAFDLEEDSLSQFHIPTFSNLVPVSVFPFLTLDIQWKQFFLDRTSTITFVHAYIVNTFLELESYALQARTGTKRNIYPVGPIPIIAEDQNKKDIAEEEGSKLKEWLDDQPPCSVLFLCPGRWDSFGDRDQVREIARALERSGVHFVWSLQKPPPYGSMRSPSDYSNLELERLLPEKFLERTREIGRVMGWAPRAQILAHEAVGGFLSNCAWRDIMESVHHGVPIATWPHDEEQHLNAFLLVRELKLGVEISLDYRREGRTMINAERIEKGIREVMEEESEVRKKVKEMSEISKMALMEGGSSRHFLERFIKERLNGG